MTILKINRQLLPQDCQHFSDEDIISISTSTRLRLMLPKVAKAVSLTNTQAVLVCGNQCRH